MNFLSRSAHWLLAVAALLIVAVGGLGWIIATIAETIAWNAYGPLSYTAKNYEAAQRTWDESLSVQNAFGLVFLVGLVGVLLTLAVLALRRPVEQSASTPPVA